MKKFFVALGSLMMVLGLKAQVPVKKETTRALANPASKSREAIGHAVPKVESSAMPKVEHKAMLKVERNALPKVEGRAFPKVEGNAMPKVEGR